MLSVEAVMRPKWTGADKLKGLEQLGILQTAQKITSARKSQFAERKIRQITASAIILTKCETVGPSQRRSRSTATATSANLAAKMLHFQIMAWIGAIVQNSAVNEPNI